MQGYEGAAEWDIADRAKYDTKLPGQLPFLRFHSHIKEDELLPIPEEHTMLHEDFQWEIERWTLFMALPKLMNWDKQMWQIIE